jgi:hypothetical protein
LFATGFVLFLIVTPLFISAFRLEKLQVNQSRDLQAPTSTIDLNNIMLNSWKEWDALLTRWLSLNGTLVDPYDYVLRNWGVPSNTSLSGISFYLLALINMYEQASNDYDLSNYYLSKLRAMIQGLIDNPFCYTDVYIGGQGNTNIFHVPSFYSSNSEHAFDPAPTMLTAFASVKLWKSTHSEKFKLLADRVAKESLQLAAVDNSTDLAWSQYYSWGRDENNARQLTWRQAIITCFYTLYGSEIDPIYLTYVNRTLHWQFRAQLPSGGLASSIGETIPDKAYTGIQMFLFTLGYRTSSGQYLGHKTNMTNAILWLQSLPIDFAQMESYAVTGALINSWKANFTVDTRKTITAAYLGLKTLNFTTYGIFTKSGITDGAYGWRWPQPFIVSFLSTYPLPDGAFQPSEIAGLIDYSSVPAEDRDLLYEWKTGYAFDRLRINSPYGSGLYHWSGQGQRETMYFYFGWKKAPPYETPVSIVDNNQYYLNVKSVYTSATIDQQIYANGPATAQVSGTTTFSVLHWSQAKTDITLANSTTVTLNDLANSTFSLGNTFIIRQNETPTQFFFVRSSNSIWTAYNDTSVLQLTTTFTDGSKLLLARLEAPDISVSEAFDLFNYYITYFSQTPITFMQMVESYFQLKNRIGERQYGLPRWRASYENATTKEVKLVALNLPENVNVSDWDFASQHLSAIILGALGVNSILEIYSGYQFFPIQVFINDVNQTGFQGTVWSYDLTTRTFTVDLAFSPSLLKLDVYFLEDSTPPQILSVQRSIQNPEYNDTVTISANITDVTGITHFVSGVGTVLLNYWNRTYWLNITMTLNTNNSLYEVQIPSLPYATLVNYSIHAADRAGNWNQSETFSYVTVDTYPPNITILVQQLLPNRTRVLIPADGEYSSGNATITVYCQEDNLNNMSLFIDDVLAKVWVKNGTQSYWWDTTGLVDGSSHVFELVADDLAGNSAPTTATLFPDNTPSSIGTPYWTPQNPTPGENVTVSVSVTDAASGAEIVALWYSVDKSLYPYPQSMTLKDGIWSGTISGQQNGALIEFFIEVYDKAGNRAQTQSSYKYSVGYSQFPIFLLIFLAVVLMGILVTAGAFVYYRKRQKSRNSKLAKEPANTDSRQAVT